MKYFRPTNDDDSTSTRTRRRVLRATVASFLAIAGAITGSVMIAAPASAAVGSCTYVFGSNGVSTSGYARVCLGSASTYSAGVNVPFQTRSNAPDNVYVVAAFNYGSYNTGYSRLGPNSPSTYSATKSTNISGWEGVNFKLCYDKPFQTDPCYAAKVIWRY